MKHLHFDMIGAYMAGETRHPQRAMQALGITYQDATPVAMGDFWIFWNCENYPDTLPSWLEVEKRTTDQMEKCGYLSNDEATAIDRRVATYRRNGANNG